MNSSSSDILWKGGVLKEKAEKWRPSDRAPQVSGKRVWLKLGRGKEVVGQAGRWAFRAGCWSEVTLFGGPHDLKIRLVVSVGLFGMNVQGPK